MHGSKVLEQGHHKSGNWLIYENKAMVDFLKDKGFDSMRLAENQGGAMNTIAVFDPKNIRSRFAEFDPARAESPDLLASRTGTPELAAIANALRGGTDTPAAPAITPQDGWNQRYAQQQSDAAVAAEKQRKQQGLAELLARGERRAQAGGVF